MLMIVPGEKLRRHGCLNQMSWPSIQWLSKHFTKTLKCQLMVIQGESTTSVHPLGTMNVYMKFHSNPFNSCWDISAPKWWSIPEASLTWLKNAIKWLPGNGQKSLEARIRSNIQQGNPNAWLKNEPAIHQTKKIAHHERTLHKCFCTMKWRSQGRNPISDIISMTNDWFACLLIHLQETTQGLLSISVWQLCSLSCGLCNSDPLHIYSCNLIY